MPFAEVRKTEVRSNKCNLGNKHRKKSLLSIILSNWSYFWLVYCLTYLSRQLSFELKISSVLTLKAPNKNCCRRHFNF